MGSLHLPGVAVVTGAGKWSGIGRETALAFARSGARGVVFADINFETASAAARESEASATHKEYLALPIVVDTANETAVEQMVTKTVEKFGRIDYSVNSAGIGSQSIKPITELDMAGFQKAYDINTKGVLHCMKYMMRVMEKQDFETIPGRARSGKRNVGRGTIVNVSSISGVVTLPNMGPYISSKWAVRAITKVAALEGGPNGIRVNCTCPFGVEGPMMDRAFEKMPDWKPVLEKNCPLGRLSDMDEQADTILFLSSPLSSFVNGQALVVDGGVSLKAQT